jgi:hypothetical protein
LVNFARTLPENARHISKMDGIALWIAGIGITLLVGELAYLAFV